ncbi:MAG: hypothetical protein HC915_05720 [Anaerolineae bacterium]|nr:hypothetical protein [Anaerolineae bacterium]
MDALLQTRGELEAEVQAATAPPALDYGLALHRVGVRDVILPGMVRMIMLKEVEAEREGRADLIRARHEVAAARARVNAAKLLAENPQMLQVQQMETLAALAGKPGSLVLLPNVTELLAPWLGTTPPVAPPSLG